MTEEEMQMIGQAEDVLKLLFRRDPEKVQGNEGHVLTNSQFGDLFDILYEDAPETSLAKYDYLIDATPACRFTAKMSSRFSVLNGHDRDTLTRQIYALSAKCLPCTADNLHWLLSDSDTGHRYITVFNNEGNRRSIHNGDNLIREADSSTILSFREPAQPECVIRGDGAVKLEQIDSRHWRLSVPAAGFAILRY